MEYMDFWKKIFPEQETLDRSETLRSINDMTDGQLSPRPDREMVEYQNRVAPIYGAYERAHFQTQTMGHIMAHLKFPIATLVSLGSGPASYELWLLSEGKVNFGILVDQSPVMLERAKGIAKELGIEGRIQCVCADVLENGIPLKSADMVFSINAMHWSRRWARWIFEAGRVSKDKGQVFLSCSTGAPRSAIWPKNFVKEAKKYLNVSFHGFLSPPEPQLVGGMIAVPTRYFAVGIRRNRS